MNSTVMETCSRSVGLNSARPRDALPRCSRKTFVEPYRKIRKPSTNSAEGIHLAEACLGLTFHA